MTPSPVYDTIIVGSGPAGATLARSLSQRGQNLLILEWGDHTPLTGSFWQMASIAAIPGKSAFLGRDLSLLIRGITSGGSSAINYATAMAPPFAKFDGHGIDLRPYANLMAKTVPCTPLPDHLIGPRAQHIWQSALACGLDWHKLDKMIDAQHCQADCNLCGYGCPQPLAKWTARQFINEAIATGAQYITNAQVTQALIHSQRVTGVEYLHQGQRKTARAANVVLCAGGIGSAQILQNSGIDGAGSQLFVDPVVAVMGRMVSPFDQQELPMATGMHLPDDGLVLADLALPKPFFQLFTAQTGRLHRLFDHDKTLTVMVKAADQPHGRVSKRWVNNVLHQQDRHALQKGVDIAKQVLTEAGAKGLYTTHHFAAHQGGTAAIGQVVDSDLQTQTAGLYVCDASVIPGTWGLPPTFTLLCLAQRLADHLS